ncbi:pseudouridine synthase [Sinorhizobium sp. BG8]|uniref:pseudouridine synthase n=1 Tax=Sinorhizobium sp. BG8 TaxID=2613773 RepID=UPI00193DF066|nr:pseudouridine synthase [Sinorhizobium sp. BG8]QRM54472.1 pseudouridine synthase [Sinorhizobium sp. BG8]
MTPKDKPRRPGAKPFDRDRKPRDGGGKPGSKKPFAAKSAGPKASGGKPFAAKTEKKAPVRASAQAADHATAQGPERISKLLARAGVASRRDVERMIMEGRVSVNGTVLDTPVLNATLADRIEVDGQPIRGIERTRLWLYHKPAGLVTTNSDPEGRPTVFENLPEDLPRVLSIGRLDINTEGLLLLTNDGGLARVLELPSTGWLRRYRVRAHGKIEQEALDKLKDGIAVDGVLYGAIDATLDKVQGSNVWITMGLREGKNREIKNVLGALGLEVNRLIRLSYGPFQLGDLPEGRAQEIRGRMLRDQLGPRLIDEAKANFDAPLFEREQEMEEAPARAAKPAREERQERPFREKEGDRREKARGRLDTRRDDRQDGKRGGGWDREESRFDDRPKREPGNRTRKANVWMAPGARPVAEKKAKAAEGEEAVKRTPRPRPEGAPKVKRYGRNWDGEATTSTHKYDPDKKKSGFRAGPSGGERKPRVLGDDDGGDWIRASEPESRPRDGERGGFGRKRSGAGDERAAREYGDRPARSERKPRFEGDRPFGDRPPRREGGKPFGERPAGDKPRDKPFGGKPGGKSFSGKPGGKPFGGKSFGGKSGGGKPGGGKPGGRPSGASRPRGKGK